MLNKLEKKRFKEEKAITLIALIITIIVLLILAGVAISTLAGENGVINRAQKSVEKNDVGAFKDAVSLAYMHALSDDNLGVKGIQTVTVNDIIGELTKDYTIKRIPLGTVSLRNPETDGNVEIFLGDGAKTVSVSASDAGFTNYVELKGKWYQFNLENGKVTVGEGVQEEPEGDDTLTLAATSSDTNKVTVSPDQDNFTVTITPVAETTDPVTITITYGESTTMNVTVAAKYTLTAAPSDANMGTVSITANPVAIGTNEYRKGTQITLTATPKAGTEYVFKGWYEGTDTTDSTKLIEGAGSEYTFTLNEAKIITAKFGEDAIDNSGSLVEGFVDDLGTRAMIYLYANPDQNTAGATVTIKDKDGNTLTNADGESQTTVKAVAKNGEGKLEITGLNYADAKKYYLAYPVTQNGTYTFKVSKGTTETKTKIKVKNIETFTAIDADALSSKTEAVTKNNTTIAYKYKESDTKFAYVPAGYYVDTNSNIDTGLVITDYIDANGYSTGNEWVWVPVNNTVGNNDIKVTESGTVKGATSVSYTQYAKLYSFSKARKRDNYGTFYLTGNSSTANLGKPSDVTGCVEPALLSSYAYSDKDYITSISKRDGTGNFASGQIADVAKQYVKDYNSMVSSVETYHGFYIGRYELANISGTAKEQPGVSYTKETWFSLYNKCLNLNKTGTATETSMMYGSLWDATLQWLSSNYNVGYTGNTSSGYGNYYGSTVTVSNANKTSSIIVKDCYVCRGLTSGQTSYTRSNNVYDLAGNCLDWTQEAYYSSRVLRGGSYGGDGVNCWYASGRDDYRPTRSNDNFSSRPQLYIKVELNS